MSLTAGALSQVSVSANGAVLSSAVATSGTAPYTYQWYRSTASGFSPGPSNILSGATSLSLTDSGLIPNSTYYYKVVVTDSAAPAATATSSQLAVTTTATSIAQNAFAMSPIVGMVDMPYNYNTKSALIDVSAGSAVYYPGQAMKIVASTAGGPPRLIACSADSDEVFGFINYNIKNQSFVVGQACEVSQAGNVIWLYASEAITQGARVCLDSSQVGAVQAAGHTGKNVVGWALDGAAAMGALIRVQLLCPSFATA